MKTSSILLAAALTTAGLAWADHTEDHENANTNSQQLSRRPYSAPAEKNTVLEGNAALEKNNDRAEKNYKTLQLHMLSKRPYAAKGTD
jgi:hypothetical protein